MMLASASDSVQGVLNLAADPCLPGVTQLLYQLHKLESAAPSSTPSTPTQPALGVGLCKVVLPLRAAIFVRQNPVVGYGAIAVFLGIFVGIGYKLGKRGTK